MCYTIDVLYILLLGAVFIYLRLKNYKKCLHCLCIEQSNHDQIKYKLISYNTYNNVKYVINKH